MARPHHCDFRVEAEALRAKLTAVLSRVDELERTLAAQKKKAIGRTSEKSKRPPPNRPAPRAKNDAGAQAERAKQRAARDTLTLVNVDHRVSDEERGHCPECGENCFVEVARDTSSEYEWMPGRLVRKLHSRETLRCTTCNHFVRAPAPVRVVDGGLYGPAFIARLVVGKCADCVPLYRQVTALGREGLHVARATLVDLFHRAAELIKPIYDRMEALVPKSPVVYADETSLKMQRVEKLGYIWTFATENEVVYRFSPDRSGETPKELLGESTGVLVVDGYTGYNHVTVPGRRTRAGCNAHARRKFVDIDDDHAREMIAHFDEVFRVERNAARDGVLGTAAHLELRKQRSRPAMEAIKKWCDDNADNHAPKTPMGAAIRYVRNQWEPLTVFLDDIRIQPHNMISERLLRVIALGRKNYLFVGHKEAGQNLAMLCSIIATCSLHDVNPTEYLADVLVRVQDQRAADLDALLPLRWKQDLGQPAGP